MLVCTCRRREVPYISTGEVGGFVQYWELANEREGAGGRGRDRASGKRGEGWRYHDKVGEVEEGRAGASAVAATTAAGGGGHTARVNTTRTSGQAPCYRLHPHGGCSGSRRRSRSKSSTSTSRCNAEKWRRGRQGGEKRGGGGVGEEAAGRQVPVSQDSRATVPS